MGMFRSEEDRFLLCFDEFGVHVDKHGDPIRPGVLIEWEGTAERVACHPPYILLFDTRFIEIRYIDTGRLAQIIPGNDIRCIWDGRGVSSNPTPQRPVDPREQQEARVHGVMTNTEGMGRSKSVAQIVFELVPTIPIYPPPAPRQQHQGYEQQRRNSGGSSLQDRQSMHSVQPNSQPYATGDVPVGYGYDQRANGYAAYQQQHPQQAYQQQPYYPQMNQGGSSQQPAGYYNYARPSTSGSWRS